MIFFINGTEINFDVNTKEISFNDRVIKPSVRTYWDMKNIYSESENKDDNEWLYFMYRWVYLNKEDEELFKENNLRYDVTIILPEIIWTEFNKTYWHYHPENSSWKKFEEIYEVLSWSALYLQQNNEEVNFTDAFFWDKVVMSESFWHVTINPSDEEILVMANIVDDTFDSEYWEYNSKKWANYYYKTSWFEKNPNYNDDIEIIEKDDLFEWGDMYEQFLNNPDKFNFLH